VNYLKMISIVTILLLAATVSAKEFDGIYAGGTGSVLIDKTLNTPETSSLVNPLLIELEISENKSAVSKEAFDIKASGRISQNGEDHNLDLKCGNEISKLTEENVDVNLGDIKEGSWYCYPKNKYLILENSENTEIKIKVALDTSWRLKSGNYNINAKIHPISIIPQSKNSKIEVKEGKANIESSDIVTTNNASMKSQDLLYYTSIRKKDVENPVVSFSSEEEGITLWRCLGTLKGCTWKKAGSTKGKKLEKTITYSGLYALSQKTAKNSKKGNKRNKNRKNSANNLTSGKNSNISRKMVDTSGRKRVGSEIKVETHEDNQLADGSLFLNGNFIGTIEDGEASFTPLDAGKWQLTARKGDQKINKQLSIKERTKTQNITNKIKKKLENLLYKIIQLLKLLIPF